MKNRIPFAALTFAFTIAGACISYAFRDSIEAGCVVIILIALVGGLASAVCAIVD
jgi:hypothetical protein